MYWILELYITQKVAHLPSWQPCWTVHRPGWGLGEEGWCYFKKWLVLGSKRNRSVYERTWNQSLNTGGLFTHSALLSLSGFLHLPLFSSCGGFDAVDRCHKSSLHAQMLSLYRRFSVGSGRFPLLCLWFSLGKQEGSLFASLPICTRFLHWHIDTSGCFSYYPAQKNRLIKTHKLIFVDDLSGRKDLNSMSHGS